MTKDTPIIERLPSPVSDADFHDLARLLVDAVDSGAAVSFLAPLTLVRAEAWWRKTISTAHATAIVLVARDTEGIVETVQLHPAWAPNQPHRAEIAKLLVHRRGRRARLGTRLMQAIEDAARRGARVYPPDLGYEARGPGGARVSATRLDFCGDDPSFRL